MITHHPEDVMIVEYANGSLAEAESLLVATHASMCGECRDRIADFEAIGAALLEAGEEAPMETTTLDALMARIEEIGGDSADEKADLADTVLDVDTLRLVPPPLRPLLSDSLSALKWRRAGRGIKKVDLPDYGDHKIALLDIRAGQKVPTHTHSGTEYTLVLRGSFSDGSAHFLPGDIAQADSSVDHAPVADAGDSCLCLTIQDGGTRLTGPIGRYLNSVVHG